ncbi:MAG: hypothetical protein J0L61_13000, partial [Planctomycetes bacterium]|nr:hypothetical protein [Planctomycetota bacterium]
MFIWGEKAADALQQSAGLGTLTASLATHEDLRRALQLAGLAGAECRDAAVTLNLPAENDAATSPIPSDRITRWVGGPGQGAVEGAVLKAFQAPALKVAALDVPVVLDAVEEAGRRDDDALVDEESGHQQSRDLHLMASDSVRFYAAAARLARALLAEQRFVPMAEQDQANPLDPPRARWRAWLNDDATLQRVALLLSAMPPSARAVVDTLRHQPVAILSDLFSAVVDSWARRALRAENMVDAIEGRDAGVDPHVGLLSGLLDGAPEFPAEPARRFQIPRAVRRWIGNLEERGASGQWRLCLKLTEPLSLTGLKDLAPPS